MNSTQGTQIIVQLSCNYLFKLGPLPQVQHVSKDVGLTTAWGVIMSSENLSRLFFAHFQ